MKNIQEILLKCGSIGKLILGDEEIDVYVESSKTKLQQVINDLNFGKETSCITSLKVLVYGDDFCKAKELKENEN